MFIRKQIKKWWPAIIPGLGLIVVWQLYQFLAHGIAIASDDWIRTASDSELCREYAGLALADVDPRGTRASSRQKMKVELTRRPVMQRQIERESLDDLKPRIGMRRDAVRCIKGEPPISSSQVETLFGTVSIDNFDDVIVTYADGSVISIGQ